MAAKKILRWRKDTDQFDSLDPEGLGQGLVRTPTAVELQRNGFEVVPDEEWDKALQGFNADRQHVQYLAQQSAAKDTGPGMPAGRTPFFLGDNAVHEARKPNQSLESALTWAAGLGRVPPQQEPQADVSVGMPTVVSRTPAAPTPKRPGVQVRPAGQVDSAVAERFLANARGGGAKPAPAALASVYAVDPVVGDYLAQQMGGLEEAQGQARDRRLAAGLAHAGAMVNTALSGARHEEDAYSDLERGADQPVVDYSQRRALADRVQAEARDHAERLRKAGLDERDFRFKTEQAKRQEQLDRDRMALQERMRADDRDARSKDLAYRYAEMRQQRQFREQDKTAEAKQKEKERQDRYDEKDMAELAKRSQDAAQMKADLETVNSHLRDSDIPGVGPIVSALPEFFLSADGTELRQAAIRLYRMKVRMESGQTVTPQEAATALEARGMGPGRSETAFRKGMESLRNEAVMALRNIESGYRPHVVALRREYGGTTSAEMPTTAPTPTGISRVSKRTGRVEQQMSDGTWVPR